MSLLQAIYQQELGRAPDAAGMQFYQDLLDAGTMTPAEIQAHISGSDEGMTFDPTGGIAAGAPAAQPTNQGLSTGDLLQMAMEMAQQGSQGYRATRTADVDRAPYLNAYTQDVIDTTLGQLDRTNQMDQNRLDASAAAAGAFGGSRHGVLGAEVQRGYQDQVADTTALMNQANFQNAMGLAQGDANAMNTASQSNINSLFNASQMMTNLAGQNFGMQNTANQNLMRDGMMQQQSTQSLIDAIRGQTMGFNNSAQNSLGPLLTALGSLPQQGSESSTSNNPGLFGILGSLLSI